MTRTIKIFLLCLSVILFDSNFVSALDYGDDFIIIEGGTFRMGSSDGEDDERPVHNVTLTDFSLSKYETTIGDFRKFVESTDYKTTAEQLNGSWGYEYKWRILSDMNWRNPFFEQTDDSPVTCISWYDAIEYCNWLSREAGLLPVYRITGEYVIWRKNVDGFRLPTENRPPYKIGSQARIIVFF